jgi:uncharacterized membrane-anchored protein YhcB (DUF1043 family)
MIDPISFILGAECLLLGMFITMIVQTAIHARRTRKEIEARLAEAKASMEKAEAEILASFERIEKLTASMIETDALATAQRIESKLDSHLRIAQ